MADIDIDPFGEHESRPEETGENIPLDPVIPGRSSTWEPLGYVKARVQEHFSKKDVSRP